MAIGPPKGSNLSIRFEKTSAKKIIFFLVKMTKSYGKKSSKAVEGPAFCTHKRRKHLLSKIVQGFMAKAQQGGR